MLSRLLCLEESVERLREGRFQVIRWSKRRIYIDQLAVAAAVFLLSLWLMPYYVNGDQTHYRRVYAELATLDLGDALEFYSLALSSNEWVHFALSWIFSRYVDKDLFISAFNSILAYAGMSLLRKWGASPTLAVTIALTNFYFLVLYFAAERLKFAFIFLALSLLWVGQAYKAVILGGFAVASHVQVIIVYAFVFARFIFAQIATVLVKRKGLAYLLAISLIGVALVLPFEEQILAKFVAHADDRGLLNLGRIFIFFMMALFYSSRKTDLVIMFAPIFVSAFLVGGERVNIFAYFLFLHTALSVNRGCNVGVVASSAYFAYSSFGFVYKIIENGDGFF